MGSASISGREVFDPKINDCVKKTLRLTGHGGGQVCENHVRELRTFFTLSQRHEVFFVKHKLESFKDFLAKNTEF